MLSCSRECVTIRSSFPYLAEFRATPISGNEIGKTANEAKRMSGASARCFSQLAQAGIGGLVRVEQQAGRVLPRLFFPVISELDDHALSARPRSRLRFSSASRPPWSLRSCAMAVTADRVADGHKSFIPKGLDCIP